MVDVEAGDLAIAAQDAGGHRIFGSDDVAYAIGFFKLLQRAVVSDGEYEQALIRRVVPDAWVTGLILVDDLYRE